MEHPESRFTYFLLAVISEKLEGEAQKYISMLKPLQWKAQPRVNKIRKFYQTISHS